LPVVFAFLVAQIEIGPTPEKLNQIRLAIGILYLSCELVEATTVHTTLHLQRISFGQHEYASFLKDEVLAIKCMEVRLSSACTSAQAVQLGGLRNRIRTAWESALMESSHAFDSTFVWAGFLCELSHRLH